MKYILILTICLAGCNSKAQSVKPASMADAGVDSGVQEDDTDWMYYYFLMSQSYE